MGVRRAWTGPVIGVALLVGLSACTSPRERRDAAVEAVRARSDEAFTEAAGRPERGPTAPARRAVPAPAEDPDVRVLGPDPTGCTWAASRAAVIFGERDTRHQAEAQAIADARARAMHVVLGVSLQHRFIDFQQESLRGDVSLTESLLRVTQLGRVLKERVVASGPEDLADCRGCRYGATIETCIVPLPDRSDRGFRVSVELDRLAFRHGDEGTIRVTVTRDAYIYIYNVGLDWNGALLFPNRYAGDNRLAAGDTLRYPDDGLRRRGIRVVAQLPDKADVSAEMIRVIAARTAIPREILEVGAAGSFLDFMQALNASDVEWIDDAQAFTITRR